MLARNALALCVLALVLTWLVTPPHGSTAAGTQPPVPWTVEFVRSGNPAVYELTQAGGMPVETSAAAARPEVRDIPGFPAPNAMTRYGSRLYVSNYVDLYTGYLQVVDISVPGGEFITGVITAPVNVFDLAAVDDRLYAVGQAHGELYERPLSGGGWISTTLQKGTSDVVEYGHLLYPNGGRMFVNHPHENVIDVVDLAARTVVTTLTGFEYYPARIAFAGDYLVVVENGLSQPDCASYGPHYSVVRLSDYSQVLRHSIQGDCPMDAVTFVNGVKEYDLLTGQVLGDISFFPVGWHMLSTGRELIVQQYWDGALYLVDYDLTHVTTTYGLITPPNYWTPPIEEMVAMPVFTDGRVFVTNRDNSALSIVDLPLGTAWQQWLPTGLRLAP
jgi:hypothetical protein